MAAQFNVGDTIHYRTHIAGRLEVCAGIVKTARRIQGQWYYFVQDSLTPVWEGSIV
jgi:hypothetical protein